MTNQIAHLRYTANPEATASVHEDGIAILHMGQGRLFSANGTGARVWCGIERHLSMETIAEEISGEYHIPASTAREHAVRFLAELVRHGLVERGSAS